MLNCLCIRCGKSNNNTWLNNHEKLLFKRIVFLVCLFERTGVSPWSLWATHGSNCLSTGSQTKVAMERQRSRAKGNFLWRYWEKGGVTTICCVRDKGKNWCVFESMWVVISKVRCHWLVSCLRLWQSAIFQAQTTIVHLWNIYSHAVFLADFV